MNDWESFSFLSHDFVLQARSVKTVKVRNWSPEQLWSAGSDRRFSHAVRCDERSLSTGSRIGGLKQYLESAQCTVRPT